MNDVPLYIAGDIGGTNLNLAAVRFPQGRSRILLAERYASHGETGIGPALKRFLAKCETTGLGCTVDGVCLAGAGPVVGRRIAMSNVPWVLDGDEAERATGCPVRLLNDFEALMRGIAVSDEADRETFREVLPGTGTPATSKFAAIGPGTGLGMGFGIRGAPPFILASEGGNARFPVWDDESARLRSWLSVRLGRDPCTEDWISGLGIAYSLEYELSRATSTDRVAEDIALLDAKERGGAVAAEAARSPTCARVMARFIEALAVAASDAALTFLPDTLYLAGGIAGKNADRIVSATFRNAFLRHGKRECADILARTRVEIVMDYGISLKGAADAARR